jgi:TonB family protein
MKNKFNILSKFHEWNDRGSPLKKWIASTWKKLVLETQYRLSGSISISLIVHLLLLLGYFGLDALDKPFEPPIREITFIDLNEIPEEPEEVITKKESPPIVKKEVPPPLPEESQVKEQPAASSTPAISLGKDKIFLDSPRKQAPINVQEYEPVAGNVNSPNDVLNVSPAIGLKKDDKTTKPAALDLGKQSDMLMALADNYQGALNFGQNTKPSIDLKPGQTVSSGPVSSSIPQAKPKLKQIEPDLKPKETQTLITGDLANREILERVIPQFPHWAKTKGVGATIALRFTVMQDGKVKETVIVERTSGSLQWDRMVISALKNWKFVPLTTGSLRQDQTGVITFQFVI